MTNAISLRPSDQICDPQDFYVPAPKDGRPVAGRVDAAMKGRVAEIVQSGIFQFKTESDLVRSALTWFIVEKIAPKMNGKFQLDVKLMEQANRSAQLIARINDVSGFVTETKRSATKLLAEGAMEQAVEVYVAALDTADRLSDPARTKALDLLREDPEFTFVRAQARRAHQLPEQQHQDDEEAA